MALVMALSLCGNVWAESLTTDDPAAKWLEDHIISDEESDEQWFKGVNVNNGYFTSKDAYDAAKSAVEDYKTLTEEQRAAVAEATEKLAEENVAFWIGEFEKWTALDYYGLLDGVTDTNVTTYVKDHIMWGVWQNDTGADKGYYTDIRGAWSWDDTNKVDVYQPDKVKAALDAYKALSPASKAELDALTVRDGNVNEKYEKSFAVWMQLREQEYRSETNEDQGTLTDIAGLTNADAKKFIDDYFETDGSTYEDDGMTCLDIWGKDMVWAPDGGHMTQASYNRAVALMAAYNALSDDAKNDLDRLCVSAYDSFGIRIFYDYGNPRMAAATGTVVYDENKHTHAAAFLSAAGMSIGADGALTIENANMVKKGDEWYFKIDYAQSGVISDTGAELASMNAAKQALEAYYGRDFDEMLKDAPLWDRDSDAFDELNALKITVNGTAMWFNQAMGFFWDTYSNTKHGGYYEEYFFRAAGYVAPKEGTNRNTDPKDFVVRVPDGLVNGVDYTYEYVTNSGDPAVDGVLTIHVKAGVKEHWLTAVQNTNKVSLNSGVLFGLEFKKPDGAVHYVGNCGQGIDGVFANYLDFSDKAMKELYAAGYDMENEDWRGGGRMMASINQVGDTLTVTSSDAYDVDHMLVVWYGAGGATDVLARYMIGIRVVVDEPFSYEFNVPTRTATVESVALNTGWERIDPDGKDLIVRPVSGKTIADLAPQNKQGDWSLGTFTLTPPDTDYTLDVQESNKLTQDGQLWVESGNTLKLYTHDDRTSTVFYTFVWTKDDAPEIREELTVRVTEAQSVFAGISKGDITAQPVTDANYTSETSKKTIGSMSTKYDATLGFMETTFNGLPQIGDVRKLRDGEGVTMQPPEGATHFRVQDGDGNRDWAYIDTSFAGQLTDGLARADSETYALGELTPDAKKRLTLAYAAVDVLEVEGLSIYFTTTQNYRYKVVEWLQKGEDDSYTTVGYTYIYGKNGPMVKTETTKSVANISEVQESNKAYFVCDADVNFTCNQYVQEGAANCWYFRLTVDDEDAVKTSGGYVYLPYSFFGDLTYEKAQQRADKPVILHYAKGDGTEPTRIEGEYTEYGVRFQTNSFSPFVVKLGVGEGEGEGEGEGGGTFKGMKAALDGNNTAARTYVDDYLVDSTGYVKASASDTNGISLKDSYTEAEKATIIAAVRAFREIDWQRRDPLGNVGGIHIKNDWYDCFGRYLAEMAASVGISLWGDYPSRNGVELTVGDRNISFYTDQAYGVPARDPSISVTADNEKTTYTIPYSQTYYCFAIPASKEIKSLTVKGAASTELKDEGGIVYGYSAEPFADKNITVETRNEGWFGNESNRTYMFSVQVSYDREEYTLPLVITYEDNTMEEFIVKAVEPSCDWTFSESTTKPTDAIDLLKKFYANGYTFPEVDTATDGKSTTGFDLHFAFPGELKEWTEGCGNDWDYRLIVDKTRGNVTVKVNYGSAQRWEAAARNALNDYFLADGVYFSYWFGGSPDVKSVKYGMNLYDVLGENISASTIEGLPEILKNTELVSDYYHSNGLDMAQLNKRSDTNSVLTLADEEVWLVSIAMDDEVADKNMSNAKLKYALTVTVEPTATMAVKLEDTSLPQVEPSRLKVDNVKDGWTPIMPKKTTDSIFLRSNNYTTTDEETEIAKLTVTAPAAGYTLERWSAAHVDSSDDPGKMPIPLKKTEVNIVELTWKNTAGDIKQEIVIVEAGNTQNWMDALKDPQNNINVYKPTEEDVFNSHTKADLSSNGINVEYNPDYGYFHTTINAGGVRDVSYLTAGVDIPVPTALSGEAAYYRVLTPGGSMNPTAEDVSYGTNQVTYFDSTEEHPVTDKTALRQPFMQLSTLNVNGLTVYYADNKHYKITLVQWLDANKKVIGYSYVYGRNGDFVTAVQTQCMDEVNAPVDKPTLEGFTTDPGFTCDKNPQTGSQDGRKVFFQFDVRNEGQHSDVYVIYLPYEYFNMTKEQGLALAAQGQHPVVYHYLDESCANAPDVIEGDYTEYGVRFETGSFSPFVIDCSGSGNDDGNGSSTGGHEHVRRYPATVSSTGNGTAGSTGATGTGNTVQSADTGDAGIVLYAALCVSSLLGMGYAGKKRR